MILVNIFLAFLALVFLFLFFFASIAIFLPNKWVKKGLGFFHSKWSSLPYERFYSIVLAGASFLAFALLLQIDFTRLPGREISWEPLHKKVLDHERIIQKEIKEKKQLEQRIKELEEQIRKLSSNQSKR
jgi:hypothetical protein